jgi:hypothetical protein
VSDKVIEDMGEEEIREFDIRELMGNAASII